MTQEQLQFLQQQFGAGGNVSGGNYYPGAYPSQLPTPPDSYSSYYPGQGFIRNMKENIIPSSSMEGIRQNPFSMQSIGDEARAGSKAMGMMAAPEEAAFYSNPETSALIKFLFTMGRQDFMRPITDVTTGQPENVTPNPDVPTDPDPNNLGPTPPSPENGSMDEAGNRVFPDQSAYGRFLQGIDDMTNGPRSAQALMPGYSYGQDVMSTDSPTGGELPYPNMPPGGYPGQRTGRSICVARRSEPSIK